MSENAIIDSYRQFNDLRYSPLIKLALGFGLLAVLPFTLDLTIAGSRIGQTIGISTLTLTLIWAYAAQSWNIMSGYTGKFSFGHAAFFGIGAYVTQALLVKGGINPWIGMLLGSLLAMVVAVAIGYLTLRYEVGGHYFVLVTLAFAELGRYIVLNSGELNGTLGFYKPLASVYASGPGLVAFQFEGIRPYYYLILSFLLVVTLVAWGLKHSQVGLYLFAIREDDTAAESLGIPVLRYYLFAFAVSAFFTAAGGAFWSMYFNTIRPDTVFGLFRNVDILLPAVVGGTATVAGPILGAFVVTPVSDVIRGSVTGVHGLHTVVYGVFFIVIALYSPKGALYWPAQVRELVRTLRDGERERVHTGDDGPEAADGAETDGDGSR